jgi:hypothetical protein
MPRKSPRSKPVRLSAKRKEQLYSTVRRIHNAERWLRVAVVIAEAARDVEWFTEDGEDLLFKDEVAQAVPKLQEVFPAHLQPRGGRAPAGQLSGGQSDS